MERLQRRWWTRFVAVLAFVIVAAAAVSGLFQFVVQSMPEYRGALQQRLSTAVGAPLRIGAMALTWRGLRPGLQLSDVTVLDSAGKPSLHIERLRVDISLSRLLQGQVAPNAVVAAGLTLQLHIDADGHWHFVGNGAGRVPGTDVHDMLDAFERLRLRRCVLQVEDDRLPADERALTFVADAALTHDGRRLQLAGTLSPPTRVAGSIGFTIAIDGDPFATAGISGHATLDAAGLRDLPWLDTRLPASTRLLFDNGTLHAELRYDSGRVVQAQARLQTNALAAVRHDHSLATAHDLRLTVDGVRTATGWRWLVPELGLQGQQVVWTGRGFVDQDTSTDVPHWHAEFDRLQLEDLTPWLALAPAATTVLQQLPGLHGRVDNVVLDAAAKAEDAPLGVRAQLDGVGWQAHDKVPGVDGIAGALQADRQGATLALNAPGLVLDAPRVFTTPVRFTALTASLHWQPGDSGWTLDVPQLSFTLATAQAAGHLQLLGGVKPSLDAVLDFSATDVTALKPYMPLDWSAPLREWLQRGIEAGRVDSGHLTLHGPLVDFPYDKPGLPVDEQWALDLQASDGQLHYAPGWPDATGVSAALAFRGNGLKVTVKQARVDRLPLDSATATFIDFNDGKLAVELKAAADADTFYALLRHSPLQTRLSGLLDETNASGVAAADVHLDIPLHHAVDTHASGDIVLRDLVLGVHALAAPVRRLDGNVHFDGQHINAPSLHGTLLNTALVGAIAPADDGDDILTIGFSVTPDDALAAAYLPLALRKRLSGSSNWQAMLPLAGADAGRLTLASDLVGTTVDLPVPLGKAAEESAPLRVNVAGDNAATTVTLDGGDRYGAALRFGVAEEPAQPSSAAPAAGPAPSLTALTLRLGPGQVPAPGAAGIRLTGTPETLDLRAVVNLFASLQGSTMDAATPAFKQADLRSDHFTWGPLMLAPTHLVARPDGDDLGIAFDGDVDGNVRWSPANRHIEATFARLSLQSLPTDRAPAAAEPPSSNAPLDPTSLPTLHVDCAQLSLGAVPLGHLLVETTRTPRGQKLASLQLVGGSLTVQASGAWQRDAAGGGSSAQIGFRVDADRLGDLLGALGYARTVSAKHAAFSGSLAWPTAADGVDLAQAQGKVSVAMTNGQLNAVQPGAGRVLGLLNIYALPRRLLLNFRDVVDKGLAFDRVDGDFTLGQGQATTQNLAIVGPSVRMDMRGRIGLADQDFDEIVTVYPDISTGVTLGAALLGGPVAGGIALLAQQLVGKALDSLTKLSYRVTGNWDNPQVTRVSSGDADAAADRAEHINTPPASAASTR